MTQVETTLPDNVLDVGHEARTGCDAVRNEDFDA